MKTWKDHELFSFLLTARGKRLWGLVLSCSNGDAFDNNPYEVSKAIHPNLRQGVRAGDMTAFDLATGETVWLTFETEAEAREYYNWTVGDDGPTKLNPYEGPANVYACLYNNEGKPVTENT